jgi:hypothetical protein
VAVAWNQLTAAERASFTNGSTQPKPAAPTAATPAVDAGPGVDPVRPSGPLDYTGLSSYIGSMADLQRQVGDERAGLTRELADAKAQYGVEMGDARRGFERQTESSEDRLNRAGLLRSGTREVEDADRFREFDRHMASVEQQFGMGASARINEALARLEAYETEQRKAIEAGARMDWNELYPAAPINVDEPRGTVIGPNGQTGVIGGVAGLSDQASVNRDIAATNQATTVRPNMPAPVSNTFKNGLNDGMFKNASVMVWDAKNKRNVAKSIASMSHAEVMAALGRAVNRGVLADGYYFDSGKIYKRS